MANRSKFPAQSYGIGREYMAVQLTLAGSGQPSVTQGQSVVASAKHTGGSNVVTVTLQDAFHAVVHGGVDVRDDSNNGAYATIGTFSNEKTTTPVSFKVQTFSAGGSAANDSSLVVSFFLCLRNSNVAAGN